MFKCGQVTFNVITRKVTILKYYNDCRFSIRVSLEVRALWGQGSYPDNKVRGGVVPERDTVRGGTKTRRKHPLHSLHGYHIIFLYRPRV